MTYIVSGGALNSTHSGGWLGVAVAAFVISTKLSCVVVESG